MIFLCIQLSQNGYILHTLVKLITPDYPLFYLSISMTNKTRCIKNNIIFQIKNHQFSAYFYKNIQKYPKIHSFIFFCSNATLRNNEKSLSSLIILINFMTFSILKHPYHFSLYFYLLSSASTTLLHTFILHIKSKIVNLPIVLYKYTYCSFLVSLL